MSKLVEDVYNLRKQVEESVKENFGYCSDHTHDLLDKLSPLESQLKEQEPELYEEYANKYF